ncbi:MULTISPECIES: hypothetical protein [Brevibacillus]|uniref:hypothetical protein n=1 Tax=Brevibacillus TaxID=55080 RepID=UPI000AF8E63D|nr:MULTISPECIES: hypothetical protein [Brevibacillus]MCM3079308.1 hypothetical protein [Brevibacillus invocatus]MCM3429406.1 hypothetical protein [Brevibacillus invocatus]MDH4618371.1 hypothetical protein [Brevibacillus sp. AY1]
MNTAFLLLSIGIEIDQVQIEKMLNDCLLTDEEYASDWSLLPDPMPTSDDQVKKALPSSER